MLRGNHEGKMRWILLRRHVLTNVIPDLFADVVTEHLGPNEGAVHVPNRVANHLGSHHVAVCFADHLRPHRIAFRFADHFGSHHLSVRLADN